MYECQSSGDGDIFYLFMRYANLSSTYGRINESYFNKIKLIKKK
jgi:hypothetical protein